MQLIDFNFVRWIWFIMIMYTYEYKPQKPDSMI